MFRTHRFGPFNRRLLMLALGMLCAEPSASGQTSASGSARNSQTPTYSPPPGQLRTRDQDSGKDLEARRSVGIVLEALRANPLIAPYPIMVSWHGGRILLSGKVGTKEVYDLVVRAMIDCGIPFRESLISDTAETFKVAQAATVNGVGARDFQVEGSSALPYIYPPPLFGRVDEPFFGFEPPALSFPSRWLPRPTIENRTIPGRPALADPMRSPVASRSDPRTLRPVQEPPIKGNAQISVDEFGRVLLRGVVADEQIKAVLEQEAATVPGVTQVINELTVEDLSAKSDASSPDFLQPIGPLPGRGDRPLQVPPPPQPRPPADAVGINPKVSKTTWLGPKTIAGRVAEPNPQRSSPNVNSIRTSTSDGVITLTGQVASSYEAMLAFRAAQRKPGAREVVDELDFPLPDEDAVNPLLLKGKLEDVMPYLEAHIRRNLAGIARVDRINMRGRVLEVLGSTVRSDDAKRIPAILRSMPILRGLQIEPSFRPD